MRSAAERRCEAGERADVEAGMAKLFASEAAFELSRGDAHPMAASATFELCRSSYFRAMLRS